MKCKNLTVAVMMMAFPLLSSCSGTSSLSSSLSSSTISFSSSSSSSSTSLSISSEQPSSISEESSTISEEPKGYHKADVSSYSFQNYYGLDVMESRGMPSTGNVKAYVLPLGFSGEYDPQPTSEDIDAIQKAYFGTSDEVGYESLTSYYYKSSFGKLNITGTVAPFYKLDMSSVDFENKAKKDAVYADTITEAITKYIEERKSEGFDFSPYDSNKDGYIDSFNIVYYTSRQLDLDDGKSIWWAFCHQVNSEASLTSPNLTRFLWVPISMIRNGIYTPNIDTHTLIHETGHMLGLPDYYSATYKSSPCGGVEMMDLNLGDHGGYSKMCLGWVNPYVVDGSLSNFNITLNSYTETGDCLILRDTKIDPWNGLPYDEYLLLQYYTPTGLNKQDSTGYPYLEEAYVHGGTYEEAGLQVFHIDSRLYKETGTYNPTTLKLNPLEFTYTDEILKENVYDSENKTYTSLSHIAHGNSPWTSVVTVDNKDFTRFTLNSIIPASGSVTFLNSTSKDEIGLTKNLFGVGEQYGNDTFTQESFKDNFMYNGGWDDGSTLGYAFKVTRNDASSCDIHIYED